MTVLDDRPYDDESRAARDRARRGAQVRELADRWATAAEHWWVAWQRANPIWTSLLDLDAHCDEVEDPSVAAEAERRTEVRAFRHALQKVLGPQGAEGLDEGDWVVAEMLSAVIEAELTWMGEPGHPVNDGRGSLADLQVSTEDGPVFSWLGYLPQVACPNRERADGMVVRLSRATDRIDAAMSRYEDAAARGLVPAGCVIDRLDQMIGRVLSSPVDEDPLLAVPGPDRGVDGWDDRDERAWRDALRHEVMTSVRPALADAQQRLQRLRPAARQDDAPGLARVPGGQELYRRAVKVHSALDIDPDEVHRAGLDHLARLRGRWSRTGQASTLKISDVDELLALLRAGQHPDVRYRSPEEMEKHAAEVIARAEPVMSDWFGRMPDATCQVITAPPHLAGSGAPAWYLPPAGSRPGQYFIDSHFDPDGRDGLPTDPSMLRVEGEATAFHEAVPGHHFQLALGVELTDDLPAFMARGLQSAYAEGWGLYAEALADEMGLYSSELDRLGMLMLDAFRAARLVVDTGLHARGWSRSRAVGFMIDHVPMPRRTLEAEVDRYISWPGQALGYKLGQIEIERLRADAHRRLGADFELAYFHDVVLGSGQVTLSVLRGLVGRWVQRGGGPVWDVSG